jgi:hypothetical protein
MILRDFAIALRSVYGRICKPESIDTTLNGEIEETRWQSLPDIVDAKAYYRVALPRRQALC